MTTDRSTPPDRDHHHDLREDLLMLHPEHRLAAVHERQALLRSIRDEVRRPVPSHPIRRHLGESLMRLGRRIAGEHASARAWSG
jgi:hypothetical protein